MNWITITILLIGLGVWALATLANMSKNQPKLGQGENAMARSRPSTSEIDRFLEEVNRRKQQQQERKASPPAPAPKKEPKKVQQPLIAKPTKVTQRQVITVEPVVQAVLVAEPVRTSIPSITGTTLGSLADIQVPASVARSSDAKFVSQAKAMLHNKDGLRTMYVLNEILGKPRCMRPHRG